MPCPPLVGLFIALCSAAHPAPGATYIGRENQLQVRIPRIEGEGAGADDRRLAQRARVAAGRRAHRLLAVRSARRHSRRRFDAGADLVFADGDATSAFGRSRRTARCTRRSPIATRSPPTTTSRFCSAPSTISRQAYVFAVNPFGVQMDGTIVETGRGDRRLDADAVRAYGARSEPGLRLRVEGAVDGVRLRSRDPDSVQESQISIR